MGYKDEKFSPLVLQYRARVDNFLNSVDADHIRL